MIPAPCPWDSLPPGWHAALAEEWNCYYFYNDLGVVTWDHPVLPMVLPSVPESLCATPDEDSSKCPSVCGVSKKSTNKIPRELKCSLANDSVSESFASVFPVMALPKVHILCNSRGVRPQLHGGTVAVMGMHCSGTKVLRKYIHTYFDVTVTPAEKISKRSDEGNARVGAIALWKHTVPAGLWPLPSCDPNGNMLTVLLTIREPYAWLLSLSHHPYEIARSDNGRRRKGDVRWMFNPVRMQSTDDLFHDPFGGREYDSVVHLWTAYAKGYLNAEMAPNIGTHPTFILVKYEDMLQRPTLVMQELADLGLPRSDVPLAPIEEGVGTTASRLQLLARHSQDSTTELQRAGGAQLVNLIRQLCCHEMQLLGYA